MEDDGAASIGGYVVFTHSGPPPLPGKLNPPSSTYPVSHISIKTARGSPSLSLPHLQHLTSSPSPLQSAHQQEEGDWLSWKIVDPIQQDQDNTDLDSLTI